MLAKLEKNQGPSFGIAILHSLAKTAFCEHFSGLCDFSKTFFEKKETEKRFLHSIFRF